MADIFADEGITGTQVKKRPEFLRMIKWCKQGKIDMILTKSVSRFARNTVECLKYVRELKEMGITIIFEKEGIDTMKVASEMSISFVSAFAQSESESMSGNITWGKRKSFANGNVPFQYRNILGYRRGEDGKPEINPDEAEIVRDIYSQFLAGKSTRKIKLELEKAGVPSPKGNSEWSVSTIQNMLKNERYKGDALLQKTYTVDCISKKIRKNSGELPKYYITGNHPAIIEPEIFDRVQEELAKRRSKPRTSEKTAKTMLGKYSSKYALSQLLICGRCGTPYRRVTWSKNGKKKVVWRCVSRLDYGKKYCPDSPTIEENRLQDAIARAINDVLVNKSEALKILKMNICQGMEILDENDEEYKIKNRLEELRAERELLVETSATSGNMEMYDAQFRMIADEIQKLNTQLCEFESQIASANTNISILDDVIKVAEKLGNQPIEYDDAVVRQVVEMVRVIDSEKIEIIFVGGVKVEVGFS